MITTSIFITFFIVVSTIYILIWIKNSVILKTKKEHIIWDFFFEIFYYVFLLCYFLWISFAISLTNIDPEFDPTQWKLMSIVVYFFIPIWIPFLKMKFWEKYIRRIKTDYFTDYMLNIIYLYVIVIYSWLIFYLIKIY